MSRGPTPEVAATGKEEQERGSSERTGETSSAAEATRGPLGDDEPERLLVREREARLEAERSASTLRRLQEITAELAGALTPAKVAEHVVDTGVAAFDGAAGMVAVPSADGQRLEVIAHRGFPSEVVVAFRSLGVEDPVPATTAYRRRAPEIVETCAELRARYPELAARTTSVTGTRALLALPLLLDGKAVGVLGVTFREDRRFSPREHAFGLILARQCAQALDRARLHEAEIRAIERLRLIAQAGEVLASSLDYETTLENVACVAMPALADLCFVDMVEGTEVRRIARAYARPRAEALLGATRCGDLGLDVCPISPGRSDFHPEIDERWMRRVGRTPAHLALLRELGLCSLIRVPVVVGTETLGALTFCFAESGRHHTPADLVLAEDLALRAAIAIDNARLHRASREATLQAERANRAKDEFLRMVSHELRSPLQAILGWSQLLRSGKLREPATVAGGIAVIERNARAQARLIEDILDVSRIMSGKLRLELRPLELEPVILSALEVVRPAAVAKGVELESYAAPGVLVSGDPDRLQQVVWNLLSNAVKFTHKGGLVEVRLERLEGTAQIVVRDSGAGIEPGFLPHVFERFQQADGSTTRGHGGLGLGLAIVRDLVELHGGSVRAESGGANRGATLTVELPLRTEGQAGGAPRRPGEVDADPGLPLTRLDGLRVLVVDDDADARELLTRLLTDCGAEVSTAGSARGAIEQLETFAAEVLVSDVAMPDEDGYSLIRRVRASGRRYAGLPALALTAYAGPDDARRAVLAGFQAYLPKPCEPAMLSALVGSLGSTTRPPRPSAEKPSLLP